MSAPAAIEILGLRKQFRQSSGWFAPARQLTAVDGVSLSVPAGSALGIVGESGCGKSTLAKLILGLLPPSEGDIRVDGRRLAELDRRERARLIQPVFQDPFSSLNPRRSIGEIIGQPLAAQGDIPSGVQLERVLAMMARVGLAPEMVDRRPAELSGGQRQRVAIARALVLRPRIVVCDEPTSALDVSVQAQILNLLAELRREFDLTYLFISHNLAVVEHVATDVAVMYLGRIVEQAPVDDFFAAPQHPYAKALLASVLSLDPARGLPDVPLDDSFPDPAAIPPGCRYHPRCAVALDVCHQHAPVSTSEAGHMVECFLATSS